jgi:hypothetical protein
LAGLTAGESVENRFDLLTHLWINSLALGQGKTNCQPCQGRYQTHFHWFPPDVSCSPNNPPHSAGPGKEGRIHHGPAPYILHVHFNIMPTLLAGAYITGKKIAPLITLGP